MNLKTFLTVAAIILCAIFIYKLGAKESLSSTSSTVKLENGVQIVDLTAKAGYSPNNIQVKSGIPIRLRVLTQNTFDCSSSFQIPSLDIAKILPPTGATEFDLPAMEAGKTLAGNCSMNMYRFTLKAI